MTEAAAERAVRETDHFALFDLPPAFDLDLEQLQHRYHELQKRHHPDRREASDRDALLSARLNEAYRQLRSPVGRALCLLQRLGVQVEDNGKRLDAGQLQQQFELRAELEQAASTDQLDDLRSRARALLEDSGRAFADAWQKRDAGLAQRHYLQMLFTDRFVVAINQREDELLEI